METKHTKTPWTLERELTPNGLRAEADGKTGVEIHSRGFHIGTWIDNEWDGRGPNAAFLVRACNSHDKLLAELKQAELVIRHAAQEAKGRVKAELVGGWSYHANKIKAAIAEAEKGA